MFSDLAVHGLEKNLYPHPGTAIFARELYSQRNQYTSGFLNDYKIFGLFISVRVMLHKLSTCLGKNDGGTMSCSINYMRQNPIEYSAKIFRIGPASLQEPVRVQEANLFSALLPVLGNDRLTMSHRRS